jgi:hypothetical protein
LTDNISVMPIWPENIEERSLDEMFRLQACNRAWSKQLRQESQVLVNSRLAKIISLEEYASSREQAAQQAIECRRRADVLSRLIESRGAHPLPQIA